MKDCTTCKRRPKPGSNFSKTACAHCHAWEPKDDKATVQASDGMIMAAVRRINEHGMPGHAKARA